GQEAVTARLLVAVAVELEADLCLIADSEPGHRVAVRRDDFPPARLGEDLDRFFRFNRLTGGEVEGRPLSLAAAIRIRGSRVAIRFEENRLAVLADADFPKPATFSADHLQRALGLLHRRFEVVERDFMIITAGDGQQAVRAPGHGLRPSAMLDLEGLLRFRSSRIIVEPDRVIRFDAEIVLRVIGGYRDGEAAVRIERERPDREIDSYRSSCAAVHRADDEVIRLESARDPFPIRTEIGTQDAERRNRNAARREAGGKGIVDVEKLFDRPGRARRRALKYLAIFRDGDE